MRSGGVPRTGGCAFSPRIRSRPPQPIFHPPDVPARRPAHPAHRRDRWRSAGGRDLTGRPAGPSVRWPGDNSGDRSRRRFRRGRVRARALSPGRTPGRLAGVRYRRVRRRAPGAVARRGRRDRVRRGRLGAGRGGLPGAGGGPAGGGRGDGARTPGPARRLPRRDGLPAAAARGPGRTVRAVGRCPVRPRGRRGPWDRLRRPGAVSCCRPGPRTPGSASGSGHTGASPAGRRRRLKDARVSSRPGAARPPRPTSWCRGAGCRARPGADGRPRWPVAVRSPRRTPGPAEWPGW